MGRLDFQRSWAQGNVLNVGCGENPAGLGPATVHMDLDLWRHELFVQADAHHLPFRDLAFDTVLLGDIMEHLVDPSLAVKDACRVGRRVVLTVFKEWRLGQQPGQYRQEGLTRKLEELKEQGYESIDAYMHSYAPLAAKYIRGLPETKMCHTPHINQLTEEQLRGMVPPGMRVVHWSLEPEANWQNWLIVLEH